jgi:hypothetical protein
MNPLEFRKEFIEAYVHGRVNRVSLHSTSGESRQNSLARGLKAMPQMHKVIRKELGVHFYSLSLRFDFGRISRERVANSFDDLCISCGGHEEEEPGIVILSDPIPRSRFYDRPQKGIFNHRYVPVTPGNEDRIHELVSKKNILGIVFLSSEEYAEIMAQADKRWGTVARNQYFMERGRMTEDKKYQLEDWKSRFTYLNAGRLLLSRARDYLIKS